MLNELAHGFLYGGGGHQSVVHHRLYTYIYNRPLPSVLLVVNPADDGHDRMHVTLVVHTVLAVEMGGLTVVLAEHVEGVHKVVFVTKKTDDALFVLRGQSNEALFGHVAVGLDQRFVDVKLLNAILTWILELLGTRHAVCLHRLGNFEGRIDADAVETA